MPDYTNLTQWAEDLKALTETRETLAAQLDQIDSQITGTKGKMLSALGATRRATPRRFANNHRDAIRSLAATNETLTAALVADKTGIEKKLAGVTLANLATIGELRRVGVGTYTWSSNGATTT